MSFQKIVIKSKKKTLEFASITFNKFISVINKVNKTIHKVFNSFISIFKRSKKESEDEKFQSEFPNVDRLYKKKNTGKNNTLNFQTPRLRNDQYQ